MNLKSLGIFGLLIFLCLFMVLMTSDPWYDFTSSTFLQPNNIENLLRRTAMYGILGIGVAFVIITGGIDLSIGSVVCLSGCLLALMLKVDYRGFDQHDVFQLQASNRAIVVHGDASHYQPGDRLRFAGGRRARNELVTVAGVERVRLESNGRRVGSGSLIQVEQPLGRDDDSGQVSKVWPIIEFSPGPSELTGASGPEEAGGSGAADGTAASSVTISGRHGLAPRDQLLLFHQQQGLKQLTVRSAEPLADATRVVLDQPLGDDVSNEWLAIPLRRHQRMSVPAALLVVLAVAAALGLTHGLLVTRLKLQPFVVTLCGLLIYRGLSRWLVSDQPVGFGNEYQRTLSPMGSGKWVLWTWDGPGGAESFGIPYPFFILLIAALLASIFLNRTIWGRYLLALGRNEEAARYSGINTERVTLVAYVICTMAAAIGGVLFALDANSVSPSSFGNFFELYAIAAAVLGGCSLRGGEGTILGVIAGTAVMQTLNNLILLMKISGELEFAIIGMVILIGVIADELVRRWAARSRLAGELARSSSGGTQGPSSSGGDSAGAKGRGEDSPR